MTTWDRTMEALVLVEEAEDTDEDEITLDDIIEFQMMEESDRCIADS